MTPSPPVDRTRRSTAAILAWAAAAASLAFSVFWVGQLLVLRGGDRFIMLNTLVAFAIVVWLWTAAAVIALRLERRAQLRSRATGVAIVATFALTALCLVLAVITLFS